ncbi:alpha/beta hydrolase [Mycobacterium sp. AT1]|uniref:alpha/beta hydrolase n=1 Tax=Mycobacterium sp. AT1 TaxID=1961706 RepID=UPI0009ACF0A7|nr:alpha/beta hydrolase [Mycobacterium sp. AT1]OPX12380.1 alpha/beta hydrolase [Mycobacterium sp. AT1]
MTTAPSAARTAAGGNPLSITSSGVSLSAKHFPASHDELASAGGRPCVVLAHGIGATQDSGLHPFAEAFASAGADAITFDYRHFAGSGGVPRQLVSITEQLQDYQAVVDHARRLPGVDPERIFVWGVSLSGGHVIRVAARDERIAGVLSLTPATDGLPVIAGMVRDHGIRYALRVSARGLADVAAAVRHRPPILLPVVGAPGDLAALNSPGAVAGMYATAGPSWRNEFAARLVLTVGGYRPGRSAGKVHCPVLVQIADGDRSAPPACATEAATRMKATVHHYPCDHFDVYSGAAWHGHVLRDQIAFLRRVATSDGRVRG